MYLDYYDEVDNSEAVKVIERLLNHKHAAVFQTVRMLMILALIPTSLL